ncbi:hypothetical protein WMY93_019849 [Mugilogobius chulae]|uniref:Uncharacterized protein n=1 Tax=Mugilogobius chulae TaxID=88201 RepID=A0AAW0NFM4_9GOBI
MKGIFFVSHTESIRRLSEGDKVTPPPQGHKILHLDCLVCEFYHEQCGCVSVRGPPVGGTCAESEESGQSAQTDLLSVNVLNLRSALSSLLQEDDQQPRQTRAPRLPFHVPPKRTQQGSRFALSLDVPTSILSVLIDLAKNQDMRSKAAANAQLMARIGRRRHVLTQTMDYASKCITLFTPSSLSSLAVPPRAKPFRVTNAERSVKKGLTAHSLEDLLYKVQESLSVSQENTLWTPLLNASCDQLKKCEQERTDVAKITLDLYKNNPTDFIGCLNVKATLYGAYSVSYDLQCYAAKKIFREALRWTLFSMQATGHLLVGSSCYIEQLLEAEDQGKMSLMLPSDSVVKQIRVCC